MKDMEATEASLKECRKDLENVTKDHKYALLIWWRCFHPSLEATVFAGN